MSTMKIKKGDKVRILAGKDRGKTGTVERVLPKTQAVIVTGINLVKKHQRSRGKTPAGIVTKPAPMPSSRVMAICPHCQKATRIAITVNAAGERQRVCRHCKEVFTAKES